MIKHIVFWKFLKEGTDEDRQKAISQFRQKTEYLKTIIPEIQEATVGYNLNEGDVYHVCIDSVFRSMEELDAYINHPEHLKVREFMNSISFDKTTFDYEF